MEKKKMNEVRRTEERFSRRPNEMRLTKKEDRKKIENMMKSLVEKIKEINSMDIIKKTFMSVISMIKEIPEYSRKSKEKIEDNKEKKGDELQEEMLLDISKWSENNNTKEKSKDSNEIFNLNDNGLVKIIDMEYEIEELKERKKRWVSI